MSNFVSDADDEQVLLESKANEEKETTDLKKLLKPWGNYKSKTVLLYDNAYFRDTEFLQICKTHQVRILPDLFTPLPDDKK